MKTASCDSLSARRAALLGLTLWAVIPAAALAQGAKADYERAANLSRQFSGKVFRDRVQANWLPVKFMIWFDSCVHTAVKAVKVSCPVRASR